jgi:hypothetical protein
MKTGAERRRAQRRPILESFSLFVVIPRKGSHRLRVYDASDHGLRFDLDLEGESSAGSPIKPGEELEVNLYLNQSLYLPLTVKVVRVEEQGTLRRVGSEFKGKPHRAYLSFLGLLDELLGEAKLA